MNRNWVALFSQTGSEIVRLREYIGNGQTQFLQTMVT